MEKRAAKKRAKFGFLADFERFLKKPTTLAYVEKNYKFFGTQHFIALRNFYFIKRPLKISQFSFTGVPPTFCLLQNFKGGR